MNIGGFNIDKKVIILIVVIVAAFVGASVLKDYSKKQKALEESRIRQEEQAKLAAAQADTEVEVFDYDAELQKSLVEKFGNPPEGFEWDVVGNLVPLANNEDMTAEDVVYAFVRSLSMLDFSTAQRYSSDSQVVETYSAYYGDVTNEVVDYYSNFLRKQYKYALTTLEIIGVQDTAIFADGTETVTLKVNVLDLTDKDFWRDDTEEIFNNMWTYSKTENDSTKMEQYLYDYVYSAYEDGKVGKVEKTIEIVLSKENGTGWLVTGDGELNALLSYEWGNDVVEYIQQEYSDYSISRSISGGN